MIFCLEKQGPSRVGLPFPSLPHHGPPEDPGGTAGSKCHLRLVQPLVLPRMSPSSLTPEGITYKCGVPLGPHFLPELALHCWGWDSGWPRSYSCSLRQGAVRDPQGTRLPDWGSAGFEGLPASDVDLNLPLLLLCWTPLPHSPIRAMYPDVCDIGCQGGCIHTVPFLLGEPGERQRNDQGMLGQ